MLQEGDKVRIQKGALVGQDFRYSRWQDEDFVFIVSSCRDDRVCVKAHGFGFLLGKDYEGTYDDKAYGCGALYVDVKDLMTIKGEPIYTKPKRRIEP